MEKSTSFQVFSLFYPSKCRFFEVIPFLPRISPLRPFFSSLRTLTPPLSSAYNKGAAGEAAPAPHVPGQVTRPAGAAQEAIAMYRIKTFNKISPVGLDRKSVV